MNEYKEYLETGILGSYKPESAIIKKSDSGASVAVFRDSTYTLTDDTCTREREMLIKGKRFIISSVFPLDARATATDKMLALIDADLQKHKKGHIGLDTTRPYAWSSSTVTAILDNKVYLGHTIGLRTTTISYKNKTTVHRPESECAVVENTHPALITQEQWDIVQDVRTHKKRTPKQMEEPNIFSGLAYCADCKRTMVLHRASTMKKSDYNFKCYTYGKRGKGECTPHHIREDELYAIILDDLRRVTHFARKKERQFAEYINRKNTTQLRQDITALQLEIETLRKRRNELTVLFKRLYEDNVLGRVTNEQFRLLSADYNDEQREIDEALPLKEERLKKTEIVVCQRRRVH